MAFQPFSSPLLRPLRREALCQSQFRPLGDGLHETSRTRKSAPPSSPPTSCRRETSHSRSRGKAQVGRGGQCAAAHEAFGQHLSCFVGIASADVTCHALEHDRWSNEARSAESPQCHPSKHRVSGDRLRGKPTRRQPCPYSLSILGSAITTSWRSLTGTPCGGITSWQQMTQLFLMTDSLEDSLERMFPLMKL